MRIGIIGGGIAGCTAAFSLAGAGHTVTLFERRDHLGGLADTFEIAGMTVERYYHFIMASDKSLLTLLEELGLRNDLNWNETRTNFFTKNRFYDFTSPFDLLKFSAVPLHTPRTAATTCNWLVPS